jgi:hypothetical protein
MLLEVPRLQPWSGEVLMTNHSAYIARIRKVLVLSLVLNAWLIAGAECVEVNYVGAIRSGVSAPVSVEASIDQIAVLQPYSSQILLFTPNGTVTHRVDIEGGARGLMRLSGTTYVYCERERGQVTAVDLHAGRQWILLRDLDDPIDIETGEGQCHVLDAGTRRIISTDPQGRVTNEISLTMDTPASLAWDRSRDVFHVFDQTTSSMHVVGSNGQNLGSYCSFGSTEGTITRGGGVACDADGYVYIVDRYQGRIAVFDPEWQFLLNIETTRLVGKAMTVPIGVAVDADGTLYVASMEDNCIHIFSLNKTAVPDGDLAAAPLFPASAGSLPVSEVRLVASLAAAADGEQTLAADFRIFEVAQDDRLVAEATGIAADEVGVDGSGRLVGTATWHPGDVLSPGAVYRWQTRARVANRVGDWSEAVTFSTQSPAIEHNLEANYPNPFNPSTTIAFSVPGGQRVLLEIYDLRGTRVWSTTIESPEAGRHTVIWNGRSTDGNSVASGVYFYRLQTEGFEQTRKMVLVR